VFFDDSQADRAAIGDLIEVELAEAGPNSLRGRLIETVAA
jgi:hypothetical protein